MQKSSDSLTTLLVSKPVLGPRRGTLAAEPVRGAVGPPAVAVGPPDALRAARLFLEESVGRVPGLDAYRGQGGALGSLPGYRSRT